MCLYRPLYEQPGGCSETLQRNCAPPSGTKHLAEVRKNFFFHAPIFWIKQSLLAVNVVTDVNYCTLTLFIFLTLFI